MASRLDGFTSVSDRVQDRGQMPETEQDANKPPASLVRGAVVQSHRTPEHALENPFAFYEM